MFEFFFKYPGTVFRKGHFVLLSPWPVWLLAAAILLAAGLLFWRVTRHRGRLTGVRPAGVWLLQTALVALVLFLLWHPAISVATLRPQQNVVAVLVDNSRSMALREGAQTREQQAGALLRSGLLDQLGRRFQVRLYRFGSQADRIQKPDQINASAPASHIGDSLRDVLEETSTLPLGAIVLLSDGADNSGGIDRATVQQIRGRRIPVHTIGFGRPRFDRDIEIEDAALPPRAIQNSRVNAQVTLRENGYAGRKARLAIRGAGKELAARDITFRRDGVAQTENLLFNAGSPGPKDLQIAVQPLADEENQNNNQLTRLLQVDGRKPRILYIEGEPRWEFKFVRRAADEDPTLQLVSMLRTTQNKIYRQGISDPKELEDGFPSKAEELFAYDGLIIGSVDLAYFNVTQQDLIKEFANRRGGGILFQGGRFALSEGGWTHSSLADLIPVALLDRTGTFHRDQTPQSLAPAGRDSLITRLVEDPQANEERWKKMPLLANYNEVGEPKPGAVVLLETDAPSKHMPLLAIQNYGRGRTALFATAGSWRWRMWQDHTDMTHYTFWQQLMRYLVTDSPGRVVGGASVSLLQDDGRIKLRAEVRDKAYNPVASAKVEARIMGPDGSHGSIEMTPLPTENGVYTADFSADKPGGYVAEIVAGSGQQELGRDTVPFRREDGVAENFHAAQNRDLLEKLADETGGRYYTASDASRLTQEISYSEAGITTRETRDIWDMPALFLLALCLRGGELALRRKWGVV